MVQPVVPIFPLAACALLAAVGCTGCPRSAEPADTPATSAPVTAAPTGSVPAPTTDSSFVLKPFGACGTTTVVVPVPAAFHSVADDADLKWSTSAPLPSRKFITVGAVCGNDDGSAAVERAATNTVKVYVTDQKEHPFDFGDATVDIRRLRQRVRLLADETRRGHRVVEVETTYPDGTPSGFVFENYRGVCWTPQTLAGGYAQLEYVASGAPKTGLAMARKQFMRLCAAFRIHVAAP